VSLDRAAVDAALRKVVAHADYDLHKGIERDEESGVDTYAEHVDRFAEAYAAAHPVEPAPEHDYEPGTRFLVIEIPPAASDEVADEITEKVFQHAAELDEQYDGPWDLFIYRQHNAPPANVPALSAGVSDEAVEAFRDWIDCGQGDDEEAFVARVRSGLEAAQPFMRPQVVASLSAGVSDGATRHEIWRLIYAAAIKPGLQPSQVAEEATDAVLNLRNGDGVNSTLYTCTGCGVRVIGHETCGDPTRPECAKR
jgi:hypothetical protein